MSRNRQVENVALSTQQRIAEKIQNLQKINIMVIGKSGVGKTYLISKIFGDIPMNNETEETIDIEFHTSNTRNLNIYDCPGFEPDVKKLKNIKKKIFRIIKDGVNSRDIKKHIHCIWYCIGPESNRFNDAEAEFIRSITDETSIYNIPVICVLTQSFDDDNTAKMVRKVQNKNLPIIKIVSVLAGDRNIKFGSRNVNIPAHGMDELIDAIANILPRHLQETLISIQNVSLLSKREWAAGIIITASIAAGAVGYFDLELLTRYTSLGGIISAMLVGISFDYGVYLPVTIIGIIVLSSFTQKDKLIRIFKSINSKWIPGIKTAIGACLAVIIIGSLFAYIVDMIYTEKIDINSLSTDEIKEYIISIIDDIDSVAVSKRLICRI